MKKIALYLRTSTRDGRQNLENQRQALEAYATERGWTIYREYSDTFSGTTPPAELPGLTALLADAAAGKFRIVCVWSLDRFSRRSIAETFSLIARLRASGVEFYSLTEEHFRTSGPAGDLLLAVAAWIAEQEAQRLRDRILAGMKRASAEGKTAGRPHREIDLAHIENLRKTGKSLRQIMRETGHPLATLQRHLKAKAS